jgi:multidrug efflux pump subunit AcrB
MADDKGFVSQVVSASLSGGLPVLILILALGVGSFALLQTPREEEPQIVVPMSDILISAPTLSARQVERLVTTPLEKVLTQIDGVEHVYSTSEDGGAVVTTRFFVGEDREDSLVKLYNKILSNQDIIPQAVTSWVVKPVEIDDVPIVIATLWSEAPAVDDYELRRLADELAISLQTVTDTNRIEVIGGRTRQFRVNLDPTAMVARQTDVADILFALSASNIRHPAGSLQLANQEIRVEVDARIQDIDALAQLTVNVLDGVPVPLDDVADVVDGPPAAASYHWIGFGPAHARHGMQRYPAVHIAIAKKKGSNAVTVAQELAIHLEKAGRDLFPAGVFVETTRDYGATADQKIGDLVASLGVAVATVVVLIGFVLGWRAALVVALAVPICYGLTLTLGYFAGYTINRVTLFALILALGLLVDDPITGVDNIERHLGRSTSAGSDISNAIFEIRMPLLMSTLAVIIAFAPMSFITGMMGPYMSPMAFNVPVAVVMSTAVAFLVTPWLGSLLLKSKSGGQPLSHDGLYGVYERVLRPMLESRRKSWIFLGLTALLFLLALSLPMLRLVPLKLLPYDNKNEFQVVVDAPETMTLEGTEAIVSKIATFLQSVPEVSTVSTFSASHSPMDFNGLVRHYYLRGRPNEAELRVTLADKLAREDQSHALILRLRPELASIAEEHGVNVKLVEVPPGPPVVATLVAEHYGTPTTAYQTLIDASASTAARLSREPGVVDVDISAADPSQRLIFVPDQEKAALSGISAQTIATTLEVAINGRTASYAGVEDEVNPLPVVVRVPFAQRDELMSLHVEGLPGIAKVRARGGVTNAPTPMVALGELGALHSVTRDQPVYHKDLQRVAYTFAEVAGRVPAAVIYDIDADRDLSDAVINQTRPLEGRTFFNSGGGQAWQLPADVTLLWAGEGEWNITLRVFRDLGIAFGVAILGIFIVVRLQTGLATLTGIIMLSIPLTAVGIMPGFWILNMLAAGQVGEYADPVLFTATAMIGMIALAGIVVRNSLMLVEFVQQDLTRGAPLTEALVNSGLARARPVLLTAGTTMLGNLVITLDPIFSGLAWAVIFGVLASTAFTLFIVPVVYQLVYGDKV